jgi:phosphatidate cytidylyltransferase
MLSPIYYALFFAIAGAIGMAIANKKADQQTRRQRWLKYFVYVLITCIILTSLRLHFFFEISFIIAGIPFIELIKNNILAFSRMRIQVILSFIIFLLIATGFILYAYSFSWMFLLYTYFQVFIFDGFCQITGQLWGKHAIAPSISPSKTIEGFIGGWLFCILSAIVVSGWINISLLSAIMFGILTGAVCFCGDLLASFYKRKLGIKDYSNWLPGQGGFLDRFDSFLFTGCIYYILCMFIFKEQFSKAF